MLDLEIAPRDVAAHLKSGETGLILLDVREPWEFQTAQIAGSKLMPMGEIPSRAFAGAGPGGAHCHGLPFRCPFLECRGVDAQPGFREGAVAEWGDR